jgi:virginiamycin A acetyltransferase
MPYGIPLFSLLRMIIKGTVAGFDGIVRPHIITYISRFRHSGVVFYPTANADRYCDFEGYNSIFSGTELSHVYMGRHSYCGGNSNITNCKIGKFCSLGPEIKIGLGIHPTNRVSTFPGFYSHNKHSINFNTSSDVIEYGSVTIGNDVWIGQRVTILPGITIGDGAIIGVGAVVTKNVSPYTIVGGIPAHVIRKRFDDVIIKQLCELQWWNWNDEFIREMSPYFYNPHLLLEAIKERNEAS